MIKAWLALLLLPIVAHLKPLLVVGTYPTYLIVKELAGSEVQIQTLLPQGADYHFYEISPKDVLRLSRADLVILASDSEAWERKVVKVLGDKVLVLLDEEKGLGGDTHFWLSPKRVMEVLPKVYSSLKRINPEGVTAYERNYENLMNALKVLDERFRKTLKACKFKSLIATHPAFTYVAVDYGFRQIAPKEGEAHGDLSLAFLKEAFRVIREEGITSVVSLKGEDSKLSSLFEKRGLRVLVFDAKLSSYSSYVSALEGVLEVLKRALGCR